MSDQTNTWEDWKKQQVERGVPSHPDLPDWYRQRLQKNGLAKGLKACKGCRHIAKRYLISDSMPARNSTVCTRFGGSDEREVNESWPGCGQRDEWGG